MFGKVHIYLNTHPPTRSQQYPPSHKCHKNTPFLRVGYQAKETKKSHTNSLHDTTRHCHYPQKKIAVIPDRNTARLSTRTCNPGTWALRRYTHRHRCARHLRILDAIHQGRGSLHELPPQRTALAHAVEDVRRPLPLPAQAAKDVHRSRIAHAKERDRSVPQNLNF